MLIAVFRRGLKNFHDLRSVGAWMCVLFVLASPAATQEVDCDFPEKAMLNIELMFGRNIGDKPGVTEEDWADFMTDEIVPKFPDGFTVLDGVGYWDGGQEQSKRVLISVDARCNPWAEAKIDEIVRAYRKRFRQESVGVVIDHACVSFCRPLSACPREMEPPTCSVPLSKDKDDNVVKTP